MAPEKFQTINDGRIKDDMPQKPWWKFLFFMSCRHPDRPKKKSEFVKFLKDTFWGEYEE